jgi:hypothetical protein
MNNWTIVSSIPWYRLYASLLGHSVIGRQLPSILDDEVVANAEPGMASVSLSV